MELLLLVIIGTGLMVMWSRLRQLEDRLARLEHGTPGSAHAELPDQPQVAADALQPPPAPAGASVETGTDGVSPPPGPSPHRVIHLDETEEDVREGASLGGLFENLVAGRLLVWLGGIALVVAGIFLVRYTIEIGLVTPELRMIAAALLGLLCIGAGEYARSGRWLSDDPRIAQALVGAGLAILYAAAYGSHILYGLIGTGTASAAMLAITAGALILSLRHGAPTAVMGLIGGFLTPWLVGDPDAGAVSLLAYLALLDLAIFLIAWRRGWTWLAAAAVAFSFVWTSLLLGREEADALAAGLFIILLSVTASLLRPGKGPELKLIQPLAIGIVQLAVLVARLDLGAEAWALFGVLSAASLILAALRPEYRLAPPVALALALMLLLAKATTGVDPMVPAATIGAILLFGVCGLALAAWKRQLLWTTIACAGLAGPLLIARAARPDLLDLSTWGLICLLLAAGPAALVWIHRERATAQPPADLNLLAAGSAAALLAGAAVWDLIPSDLVAAFWLLVATGAALASRRLGDLALAIVASVTSIVGVARAVWMVPELSTAALTGLVGEPVLATDLPGPGEALLALAIPALLLAVLRLALPPLPLGARRALPAIAGLFLIAAFYVWFKQLFGLGSAEDFAARGMIERTIVTQTLFLLGWLLGAGILRLPRIEPDLLRQGGNMLTAVAAARLIWFDILVHNPGWSAQWVGTLPVFNLILPAYLLGAFWLYSARRRADLTTRSGFWLTAFLAALIVGVALMVRQVFQGPFLNGPDMPIAEFYGYSLAGLVVSIILLLAGIRLPDKALRLAGLLLLTATIFKVFLVDASELEGILRILSFLGLGVALIGIARLYGPVLRAERNRTNRSSPAS
ncbi:MAG TPA: DUF2339 domain-containing protein [Allosphingosinicella sp.]|nr:DUF2339 domain-containing protein [Allosphingosinicella sp.]